MGWSPDRPQAHRHCYLWGVLGHFLLGMGSTGRPLHGDWVPREQCLQSWPMWRAIVITSLWFPVGDAPLSTEGPCACTCACTGSFFSERQPRDGHDPP